MATYNGEKYLKAQIDSILEQLDNEDELIISDDGSTDDTLNIIDAYKDKRIKLIHHQKNNACKIKFKLITNNFENALNHAKGDSIFLSDQDDIWLKNKKKIMYDYLAKYDIVMCNFMVQNEDANNNIAIAPESYYRKNPISNNILLNVLQSKFLGCCLAFRKDVLKYILPFPNGLFAHDFWIGCIATYFGKFYFIDQALHIYRRHGLNASDHKKSSNSLVFKISYRFIFFIQLVRRIKNFR
jgi:glycosyltransferase involved in cell wall biosynthesis